MVVFRINEACNDLPFQNRDKTRRTEPSFRRTSFERGKDYFLNGGEQWVRAFRRLMLAAGSLTPLTQSHRRDCPRRATDCRVIPLVFRGSRFGSRAKRVTNSRDVWKCRPRDLSHTLTVLCDLTSANSELLSRAIFLFFLFRRIFSHFCRFYPLFFSVHAHCIARATDQVIVLSGT